MQKRQNYEATKRHPLEGNKEQQKKKNYCKTYGLQ